MKQTFEIALPKGFTTPDNADEIANLIITLFTPDSIAYPAILSALQYENKPWFGPSLISNLQVDVIKFDTNGLTGRIKLLYDIQVTFGCEDYTKDHVGQHSYYNFKIEPSKELIYFDGEDIEQLSTADEF
ncbi:hypothetical protein ACFQZX_16675 [Mucilaginibacter litoreus]|uniref:Uncharacterized protein n=1 Tax=Mucilaginibacter litoreus TaxID=1048221 RepID=A0ABW3AW35_9SPHI